MVRYRNSAYADGLLTTNIEIWELCTAEHNMLSQDCKWQKDLFRKKMLWCAQRARQQLHRSSATVQVAACKIAVSNV